MSTVQDLDIQGILGTLCDDLRVGLDNLLKLSTEDKQYLETTVNDAISHQSKVAKDFEGHTSEPILRYLEPILCYLILKKLGDVLCD